ncbi:MAG TPA: diguanylate cyclase, partial [Arenimonas sp.]|nr:diguanylate cyclase [Arenimonas sp.]
EREETNVIAETGETRVYWTIKLPLRDAAGRVTGMCGISSDITASRAMEAKVREQKRLLDTVLDNLDAYVYMKDVGRRYLYVNANVAELFRAPREQIAGRLDEELLPADVAQRLAILDDQVLQGGVRASGEESFANVAGEMRHYWSVKIPLFDDGKVQSLLGISTDITEVAKLKQEYQRLSNTDPLTDISNRRHLLDMAEQELRRSRRQQTRIALLFFDIDHFKQINDHHGHGTGDRCLQQVVAACRERLRDSDLFGRIGGDEFVAVLPDTDVDGALQVAESLRSAVAAAPLPMPSGDPLSLRCSFGLALSRPDDSIETLLARADAALLRAKAEGRDRVLGED